VRLSEGRSGDNIYDIIKEYISVTAYKRKTVRIMSKIIKSAVSGILEGAALLFNISCFMSRKKHKGNTYYRLAVDDLKKEICIMQREASGIKAQDLGYGA
jgi:hypothetical protein